MISARVGMLLMAFGIVTGGAACDAPPVVGRSCVGVPESMCVSQLAEAERNGPPGAGRVVGIEIRCTVAACTEQAGEADIRVTYANGQTTSNGMGWAQAPAAPVGGDPVLSTPLAVIPLCLAVPEGWCREMAASGADGAGPSTAAMSSVTVRCTGTCSATAGEGSTVVTFADGTTRETGWSYNGEAP